MCVKVVGPHLVLTWDQLQWWHTAQFNCDNSTLKWWEANEWTQQGVLCVHIRSEPRTSWFKDLVLLTFQHESSCLYTYTKFTARSAEIQWTLYPRKWALYLGNENGVSRTTDCTNGPRMFPSINSPVLRDGWRTKALDCVSSSVKSSVGPVSAHLAAMCSYLYFITPCAYKTQDMPLLSGLSVKRCSVCL